MPNIKSASKRVLVSRAQNERNKAAKTLMRTNLKKFDAAVIEGDREKAEGAYKVAVKTVDRAVSKGILHKSNAAHKKSRLTLQLNKMA